MCSLLLKVMMLIVKHAPPRYMYMFSERSYSPVLQLLGHRLCSRRRFMVFAQMALCHELAKFWFRNRGKREFAQDGVLQDGMCSQNFNNSKYLYLS